jgi:hypothetical protein
MIETVGGHVALRLPYDTGYHDIDYAITRCGSSSAICTAFSAAPLSS